MFDTVAYGTVTTITYYVNSHIYKTGRSRVARRDRKVKATPSTRFSSRQLFLLRGPLSAFKPTPSLASASRARTGRVEALATCSQQAVCGPIAR